MHTAKASGTQGALYDKIGKLVACSRASSREWDEGLVEVLDAGVGQGCPGGGYRASVVLGENAEGGGGDGGGCEWGIGEFRGMVDGNGEVHGGLGRRRTSAIDVEYGHMHHQYILLPSVVDLDRQHPTSDSMTPLMVTLFVSLYSYIFITKCLQPCKI